jgi:hypothetical protein
MKSAPSARELADVYTPNFVELVWAEKRTRESAPRVGLLALLKTFQRLGYFVSLLEVPRPVLKHVAQCAGYGSIPEDLFRYGGSSARRRHMLLIRDYAGVKAWGVEAQQAMERASQDAGRTLEDLPDIINVDPAIQAMIDRAVAAALQRERGEGYVQTLRTEPAKGPRLLPFRA